MSLFLLALGAVHAAPDRLATSLELESDVFRFSQGQHEDYVAFLDYSGGLNLLDVRTWSVASVSPSCTVEDLALYTSEDDEVSLYGACDDGSLVAFSVSDFGELAAGTGENLLLDSEDALIGLVATDWGLWAASDDDVGVGLHTYDPETDVADSYGPYTTGLSGFKGLAVQGDSLVVVHGGDDVTKVAISSGGAVRNEENLSGRNFDAMASDGDNLLYLMDSGGAVVRFMTSSNEYQVVLNESDGFETLSAIAMNTSGDDPYLAVFEDTVGELRCFPFSSESVLSDTVEQSFSSTTTVDALHATEEVLYAGGNGGVLAIYRSGPWVTLEEQASETLAADEALSIRFDSDQAGEYTVSLGSTVGTILASGSVEAGASESLTLSVSDEFSEGRNRLVVQVSNSDGEGYDSILVDVDNPPSTVEFSDEHVGFGDSEIVLNFQGIDDEDLEQYEVYYATEEFSDSALPEDMLSVVAEPGEMVFVSIPNLVNGQQYFVGIRAVDDGGKQGALSAVLSIIPEPAVGAAALAGEQGGCTGLNSTGTNRLVMSAVPFMLIGLIHRRKKNAC